MGIGTGILLIAVGAVMTWGVATDSTSNFNVDTIGTILFNVGIVATLLSLAFWSRWGAAGISRRTTTYDEGVAPGAAPTTTRWARPVAAPCTRKFATRGIEQTLSPMAACFAGGHPHVRNRYNRRSRVHRASHGKATRPGNAPYARGGGIGMGRTVRQVNKRGATSARQGSVVARPAVGVLVLCALLTGCGKGGDADLPRAAAAEVVATASADPNGFVNVGYGDYSEAAFQTGISPAAVSRQDGFSAGLADLCDNSPADFTDLVQRMRADAARTEDPANFLKQRFDEVDLRVDMACRHRMSDWIAARGTVESSGSAEGLYPTVTPGPEDTSDPAQWDDDYSEDGTGTSSVHMEPDGSSSEPSPAGDDGGESTDEADTDSSDTDDTDTDDTEGSDSDSSDTGSDEESGGGDSESHAPAASSW